MGHSKIVVWLGGHKVTHQSDDESTYTYRVKDRILYIDRDGLLVAAYREWSSFHVY